MYLFPALISGFIVCVCSSIEKFFKNNLNGQIYIYIYINNMNPSQKLNFYEKRFRNQQRRQKEQAREILNTAKRLKNEISISN